MAQSIASGCSFDDAVDQQHLMKTTETALVAISDARYPALLREVFDPPLVLFARGRLELMNALLFAVVGTRRPTPYGVAACERLAGDLARAGLGIVSGMARGIDTAAHKATLAAEGDTVAVLGCGVDVVYPSENKKLAGDIAAKGLLLSEFPMGSVAFPQNFPVRNRIISGMSVGLMVVEGAQYSGSAITAKLALDQGRELFAVPGNITSKTSWGPNLLIKQGAKLVQEWNDVVTELPAEVRRRLIEAGRSRIAGEQLDLPGNTEVGTPAAATGRWVLAKLKVDAATHLDDLLDTLEDSSPSELIAALFELEMMGLVKQLPGKNFVKVW